MRRRGFIVSLVIFLVGSTGCHRTAKPDDTHPVIPTDQPLKRSDDAILANNHGKALSEKGEYAEALQELNRAIQLDPDLAHAFNNRGLVYAGMGEKAKALADYDEAIRLNPSLAPVYNNRARVWLGKGSWKSALADFDAAIRLDPALATAYIHRGIIRAACPLAELRDRAKAMDDARKGCELTRWKDSGAMSTLAAAYAENGEFDEAVKWQTKALEDEDFARVHGESAQLVLALYAARKPYRMAAPGD